jgi:hypothetical protein
MMGLLKKERLIQAVWSGETGARLKNGIGAVSLTATAKTTTEGYVTLSYEFDNFATCQKEIQEAEKSVF